MVESSSIRNLTRSSSFGQPVPVLEAVDGPWAVVSSLHLTSLEEEGRGECDGRTSKGEHCQVYEVRICKDIHLIEVHF